MRLVLLLGALLAALAAGPAAASEGATTYTEIYIAQHASDKVDLCGFYDEGGRVLHIKQFGDKVRGYLAQGSTPCLKSPQMYFYGTLSGVKFTGKMTVCNPEICVEAGQMNPTRETHFEFMAFDGGKRLYGHWVHDRIEYREEGGRVVSCWDSKKVNKLDFNATRREDDCASLQLALEQRKQMLAWYREYKVTSRGALVGPDGREVAGGFNGVQDELAQRVAGPRAGGSGVHGSIDFWRFEDVVAGNKRGHAELCWCETHCADDPNLDCVEAWAQDECQAHEAAHCRSMKELCQNQIAGRPYAEALANWQAYTGNAGAQLAEEIAAYQVSIATLEKKLKEAGCR
ncbi:hypothetical protein AAU61_03800 [Desulfocarbo indianensis]|nr:hypothetical protein AAU61_03800 [Desulfocarbo indianensis]